MGDGPEDEQTRPVVEPADESTGWYRRSVGLYGDVDRLVKTALRADPALTYAEVIAALLRAANAVAEWQHRVPREQWRKPLAEAVAELSAAIRKPLAEAVAELSAAIDKPRPPPPAAREDGSDP